MRLPRKLCEGRLLGFKLSSGVCRRGIESLHVAEVEVDAVLVEQEGIVVSFLRNLTVAEANDFVGVLDGGEAVRDDDGGASLRSIVQRFLHDRLRLSVQRRGRFVQ